MTEDKNNNIGLIKIPKAPAKGKLIISELTSQESKGLRPLTGESQQMSFSLFNNLIDNSKGFGINRKFADNFKKIQDEITPERVKESFKRNGKTFKTKDNKTALQVIDKKEEIQTADQFYQSLEKIKTGKTLQTLLALWNYANEHGSFYFNGIRLNDLMKTILKTPKTGYFDKPSKQKFTDAIHTLQNFTIYLDSNITDTDDTGKKRRMVKREFYNLISLQGAVYGRAGKDIKNESGEVVLKKGEVDDRVIVKIFGELLPSFNKGIMRGRLYSRGLLELDANKDERAILLGFKLLTRFDQLRMGAKGQDLVSDKKLYIKVNRKTLIDWSDYKQTDSQDKWRANNYLIKVLNKLVEVKCLRDFEPKELTTDDDLKIYLYPHPLAYTKAEAEQLKQQKKLSEPNETLKLLKKRVKNFGKSDTAKWLNYNIDELDKVLLEQEEISKEAKIILLKDY